MFLWGVECNLWDRSKMCRPSQIVDRTDFELCAAELAWISEKWFKDNHLDYKMFFIAEKLIQHTIVTIERKLILGSCHVRLGRGGRGWIQLRKFPNKLKNKQTFTKVKDRRPNKPSNKKNDHIYGTFIFTTLVNDTFSPKRTVLLVEQRNRLVPSRYLFFLPTEESGKNIGVRLRRREM